MKDVNIKNSCKNVNMQRCAEPAKTLFGCCNETCNSTMLNSLATKNARRHSSEFSLAPIIPRIVSVKFPTEQCDAIKRFFARMSAALLSCRVDKKYIFHVILRIFSTKDSQKNFLFSASATFFVYSIFFNGLN